MAKTKTDLVTKTLSDEDRELFLRSMGLTVDVSEQDAQELREEWPDKAILGVIGAGLF